MSNDDHSGSDHHPHEEEDEEEDVEGGMSDSAPENDGQGGKNDETTALQVIHEATSKSTARDQDDEDIVMLNKKVEAIDDEEAAITPALQRNADFIRPGAVRSTPNRRVAGSFVSAATSRQTADAPPPIEAILVDPNTADTNDHGDIDVFTAVPISVKEFVSNTPRCVMLTLSVLCMITIISVATLLTVFLISPSSDDRPPRRGGASSNGGLPPPRVPTPASFDRLPPPPSARQEQPTLLDGVPPPSAQQGQPTRYYTHHAVLFGSKLGDMTTCSDDHEMELYISCDAQDAGLRPYKIGAPASCSGVRSEENRFANTDVFDGFACTVPYSEVSYVSFDCVTSLPSQSGDPTASVRMLEPLNVPDCLNSEADDSFSFIQIMRFCSPSNIKTDSRCDAGAVETSRGACTQSTVERLGQTAECLDGNEADDCSHVVVPSYTATDIAQCPVESMPETEEQEDDSLEVILRANVTSIVEGFAQDNDGVFWDD